MIESKKSSGKSLISYFRSGIRFIERLVKNISIQLKWWWKSMDKNCNRIDLWAVKNMVHPTIKYTIGICMIIFIYVPMVLPIIMIWAVIKSI